MAVPLAAAGPLTLTPRRVLVIIGALMLGMILASLDQTVVATVDRPGHLAGSDSWEDAGAWQHGIRRHSSLQTHQGALTGRRRA